MHKTGVVLLDLNGIGMHWLDRYADNLELVETASLDENGDGVPLADLADYDGWEYLLVFLPDDPESRKLMPDLLEACRIPAEKVIYPQNGDSLLHHKAASYYMFNKDIRKTISYFESKRDNQYVTCTTDGLSYIGAATDLTIMRDMCLTGKNWAKDELIRFHRLSEKYYDFRKEQNLFCDIGANIGTSCIYFKKHLDPGIKILAFEPMPPVYKCLQANMIINDLDPEDYTLVPKGLSDRDAVLPMSYVPGNPGNCNYVNEGSDAYETPVVRFDDFLAESGVSPSRIKYLWIDIEGFEAAFFAGADDTLARTNVPVVMEFTPSALRKLNDFERLMSFLKRHYTGYIVLEDANETVHEIDELSQYSETDDPSVLFDIFLLK